MKRVWIEKTGDPSVMRVRDEADLSPGPGEVRIAVEAAVRMGWDALIGDTGIFIGMKSFGESAPCKTLYEHFGITAKAVADAALARLPR